MENSGINNNELLVTLTADIVAAYATNNRVEVADVPRLVASVHEALARLGQDERVADERPEPAVSVRASVKRDQITCLDCGKKMKILKRHLQAEHGVSPDEYRKRWDLPADYPMAAPGYVEARRDIANKAGLGRRSDKQSGSRKTEEG